MPLTRCQDNGTDGWKWGDQGKCYTYVKGNKSSEAEARKKALAQGLAIGDMQAQSKIIFDSNIPSSIIKYWKTQDRVIYILGNGLDRPFNKAHKLAKECDIPDNNVIFGNIKRLMKYRNINLYYTKTFQKDIKGLVHLTDGMELAIVGNMQEKWVTNATPNGPACPICLDLEALGWVSRGTLPPYRQAHSLIGGPNWNAPDSSCRCWKEVRNQTLGFSEESTLDNLLIIIDKHTHIENCNC